jgi:hypothetical protein
MYIQKMTDHQMTLLLFSAIVHIPNTDKDVARLSLNASVAVSAAVATAALLLLSRRCDYILPC